METRRCWMAVMAVLLAFSVVDSAAAQRKSGGPMRGEHDASLPRLPQTQMITYIDTHAHLDFLRLADPSASIAAMIATMDAFKIEKSILMPTPMGGIVGQPTYDLAKLLPALRMHPDRVMLMAGPGVLGEAYFQKDANAITDADRQAFRAKAEALARGPIVGFGEFGIVHLSIPMMGNQHPYESVPADHPLLLVLAEVAAENGLPIDVHFDLVPRRLSLPRHLNNPNARQPNPDPLLPNRESFDRFLAHERRAKIVWAHVGAEPLNTRTPDIVRDFLQRHSNLYMSFRMIKVSSKEEAIALDGDGYLKRDWKNLIVEFADRFVLGTDTFHQDGADQRGGTAEGYDNLHRILGQLPSEVAAKLARDNVAQIYRVETPPIPPAITAGTKGAEPIAPKGFAKKAKGKAKAAP